MPAFKDESEVYDYVGGIFEQAVADPVLGAKFAESGVVLRLNYTDPDASLTVDMPRREVHTGDSGPTPNVEMFMSADTGNRFWLGKVNLTLAMAKGQVKAKGSVPKLLKLVPSAKSLFPRYRAMLEENGRTDLLSA
ncbi:MAG: SCP2 sterol-binding domain-containing protein [Haloechinothrix sp.]